MLLQGSCLRRLRRPLRFVTGVPGHQKLFLRYEGGVRQNYWPRRPDHVETQEAGMTNRQADRATLQKVFDGIPRRFQKVMLLLFRGAGMEGDVSIPEGSVNLPRTRSV